MQTSAASFQGLAALLCVPSSPKQPTITNCDSQHEFDTSGLDDEATIAGTTSQFWRGDKAWSLVDWSVISSKPSTFTPASHNHTETEITDLSIDWSDLTGKPNTFAPSTHYHGGEITLAIQDASQGLSTTDYDVDSFWVNKKGHSITITSVWCESNDSSPVINLQRDDGSPANILTSDLTCGSGGATSTSLSATEKVIADGQRLDFEYVSGTGPERITVNIKYTE